MSTHNIGLEAIPMSTHNLAFYEEMTKIVFHLSSNVIKYILNMVICLSATSGNLLF